MWLGRLSELTQGSDFLTAKWMDIIDPAFGSSDMLTAVVQINLIPPQAAQFQGTKPMPVRGHDLVASQERIVTPMRTLAMVDQAFTRSSSRDQQPS